MLNDSWERNYINIFQSDLNLNKKIVYGMLVTIRTPICLNFHFGKRDAKDLQKMICVFPSDVIILKDKMLL